MQGLIVKVHDVDEDAWQGREPHPDRDMIGMYGVVVSGADIDEDGMVFVKVCLEDGRLADFALAAEVWPRPREL